MFLVPTFPSSSFPVNALGQSSLTICLLLSALCFLVSSYTIDDSCQSYKGHDISGVIQQAINEVQEMASDAFTAGFEEDESYIRLMTTLFGADSDRYNTVAGYFARASDLGPTDDFVVICDDQQVLWEPDDIYNLHPDPMGVWRDQRYRWFAAFPNFTPCNPARKFGAPAWYPYAYTMTGRLIYLCPYILDEPLRRSLRPYKDQVFNDLSIDNFVFLPTVLFYELLHTRIFNLISFEVRDFPPAWAFLNPHINTFDPRYIDSLPMKQAIGFWLARKLAIERPEATVRNDYSVVACAIALYLSKNDWAVSSRVGIASPRS